MRRSNNFRKTGEEMRKNVILVLAAVLLVTAALSDLFTPDIPSEVYNAELISEPVSEQEAFGPDQDNPDPALEDSESGQPQSSDTGASEPEESTDTQAGTQNAETIENYATTAITEVNEPENVSEPITPAPPAASETAPVPAAGKPRAEYTLLSAHEALVTSYIGLRDALKDDNEITIVYFGNDITLQDGIKINSKKTHVTIDGRNPLEPSRKQPYTLTDIDSVSFFDAIHVDIDSSTIKSIYVRDLVITGKNYYGPFSVYDAPGFEGFSITYERVDYNGPQLCYNRRGVSRFIDCSVKIHGDNGVRSPSQEFAETKHIVFSGKNTIDTASSAYSVFWHPYGGTFEISGDSSLSLISPNTSAAFGVFFADSYLHNVSVLIGNNAVFDASVSGMIAPELYTTLNSFTVEEGGAFNLKTSNTAAATVLRIGGALTVKKDSRFVINGYGGASFALLRQENGDITIGNDAVFQITADRPYSSLVNLVGSALICDDPASVLLYNANRDIQASLFAGRISLAAQQVNYWNKVSSNGFDDPPFYQWRKSGDTLLTVNGPLSIGPNGNFSSVSSNHDPSIDPPGVSPNPTTFSMSAARVMAFGRLELIVADPVAGSATISGVTAPNANIRVSFTQQETSYTLPDATADSDGAFHIPAGVPLQKGTVIHVKSNWQYLTTDAYATVTGEGKLEFFVPNVLQFYTTHLSPSKQVAKRLNPDWKAVVTDSRGGGGQWAVYARPESEITPASAGLPALSGSLIFIDASGNEGIMRTGIDTLIMRHVTAAGEDVFPIVWDDDKGILLSIEPGTVFADTLYTATVSWTIVDGV